MTVRITEAYILIPMKIIMKDMFPFVSFRTTIKISVMIAFALIITTVWVAQPVPTKSMFGLKAEAMYTDNKFTGFNTECINDEIEMYRAWGELYGKYLHPYVGEILTENDTVVVISQKDQGSETIYINISGKNLGVVIKDTNYVLIEEVLPYPENCVPTDSCHIVVDDMLSYICKYLGIKKQRWISEQSIFINTIVNWNTAELINMFCSSKVYGMSEDNHNMKIYRVVITGNKITEYVSISCNPRTHWNTKVWLSHEMLSPYSRFIKWSAERAAFLNHKLPPKTIEKTSPL